MRKMGQGAFTLIELILVMTIIVILASLVATQFAGRQKQAKIAAAKAQIEIHFATALDLYELDNGQFPTTEQGLDVLWQEPTVEPLPQDWKGPYLKKPVPLDPWGNPYIYTCPGEHNIDGYDLESYGPDGEDGGEDDIENWVEETETY